MNNQLQKAASQTKLTDFEIFYNTPFTDFQNTIHFSSNQQRDEYFPKTYKMKRFSTAFNFVRDRLVLRATVSTADTYGANYLRFKNQFENGRWYYCYITNTIYINNAVTEFDLIVDTTMTFLQGDITKYLNNAYVERQSLTNASFKHYARWLMTNNDVLSFPKQYRHQATQPWKTYYVIFTASVDLSADFGTEKNPKLTTSSGQSYDGIVSPINLYVTRSQEDFVKVTKALANYPWISQNIDNIAIVPSDIVDHNDLVRITDIKNKDLKETELYRFKDGGKTKTVEFDVMKYSQADIKKYLGYKDDYPEILMREEYASIELNAWDGQRLDVDPTFLPDKGLNIFAQATFGYHNEIRCIIDQYRSSGENSVKGLYRGSYANNAIIFNVFDDIPVLVDNYKLSKASNAHQRELANSRTISGRIREITDTSKNRDSLKDKFFNALSLTTSLAGGVAKNGLSMFNDEYEHYRDLNAQLADKAISAPSVSAQNNSQSFNIAAGIFGITAKFTSIGQGYAEQVMRYHNTFGYDFQGHNVKVYPIDSMPKMNFLKVTGNITIPDVPAQFVQQLQTVLENGVKFWKPTQNGNPFDQDLLDNNA